MPPANPGVGIIALVPDRWGGVWGSRHHYLTRLAVHYPVVWLNPAPGWREAIKHAGTRARFSRPLPNRPGFVVYEPPRWLPQLYRPTWLADLAFDLRVGQGVRHLQAMGCTKVVVYIWRPEYARAADSPEGDLTCYHIDDEYSFSPVDIPNSPEEVQLIQRADMVIIHSPGLMQKKGGINPRTTELPLGVDYQSFSAPWPEPEDLASVPHPRIGYLGRLKKQLNWPLLQDLAAQHPEWHFVLIGAVSPHPESVRAVERIGALSNVHLLGAKASHLIPRYTQHLDVCLMPYVNDDYARYGYPLKLHEYLASGRPAVGARMRTLEDFGHVVELPESTAEWADAIRRSLAPEANSLEKIQVRQRVAEAHDWDLLVERIAELFRRGLATAAEASPGSQGE